MFMNKYLGKQISYECAVFSRETTLLRLCKPLLLCLYDALTAIAAAFYTQHSDG